MDPVSTKVSAEIEAPRDWFFYWFTSVDLPKIMHRYGPLAGVVGVEDQTGPMHVPGSSRLLRLSDGTTAVEQVISCDPPKEVKYRLYDLTSLFRYLVAEAQGEIWFSEARDGGTRAEWQYSFFGRGPVATLVLKILIPLLWRGFMRSALRRSKCLAEEEAPSPSQP
jgi:hypothetical protein